MNDLLYSFYKYKIGGEIIKTLTQENIDDLNYLVDIVRYQEHDSKMLDSFIIALKEKFSLEQCTYCDKYKLLGHVCCDTTTYYVVISLKNSSDYYSFWSIGTCGLYTLDLSQAQFFVNITRDDFENDDIGVPLDLLGVTKEELLKHHQKIELRVPKSPLVDNFIKQNENGIKKRRNKK